MCLFGAVIQPDNDPKACAAAIADLNLDIALLTFQYETSPSWSIYDSFCSAIPQVQILALIQIIAGSAWTSVSPAQLGSFAAQVKQRYPGICYYTVIQEPDNVHNYPASGISVPLYLQYLNAVKSSLAQASTIKTICHGPNTSQWLSAYNPSDGRQYFHGFGALPPPKRYYWMTEWAPPLQNGQPNPIACWQKFMGYGAAIFYQLQDSTANQGIGLLDINGNQRQPAYTNAKNWLMSPS